MQQAGQGKGPACAPSRQQLLECRGWPETVKRGRQSQRPAGNTCESLTSPQPGPRQLSPAGRGSSFWGGPAPGMANLLFL